MISLHAGGRLTAPFPYFGGKSIVAERVWEHFGAVANYIEPFFGSGAILLANPLPPKFETVNDIDCHLVNFWRAVRSAPDIVAMHADWPVHEADLHSWHKQLARLTDYVRARLDADPEWFHPVLAGRWVWGKSAWIGSGWCGPKGLIRGANQLPAIGTKTSPGGVHRLSLRTQWRLPKLAPAASNGVHRLSWQDSKTIYSEFEALAHRLRYVRAACGDFGRVLSDSVSLGVTPAAVFLDPPYPTEQADSAHLYSQSDDVSVFERCIKWALAHGQDKRLRVAVCYYEGNACDGSDVSKLFQDNGWSVIKWNAGSGMRRQSNGASDNANATRERIAFSPGCLQAKQAALF